MTAKYQRRFYIFKEPFRTPHPSKRTQSLLYADFVKSALKNCQCQNGGANAAPRAMRQSRHRRGRTDGVPAGQAGGVPLEAGFDGLARRCEGKFSGHQASFMPEHCLDARITPPARDLAIGASVRGLRIIVRIAHQNRNAAPKSHNLANIEMSCRALLNTRRHLNITQEQRNFRFKTARRALLNTRRHQNIMPENAH